MTDRKAILIRVDWKDKMKRFSNETLGKLLRAMIDFEADGVIPDETSDIALIFDLIRPEMEQDRDNYIKTCERNKRNGASGGRPKTKPTETQENPQKPTGFNIDENTQNETQPNPQKPNTKTNYNSSMLITKNNLSQTRAREGTQICTRDNYFKILTVNFEDLIATHKKTDYGGVIQEVIGYFADFCVEAQKKLKFEGRVFLVNDLLQMLQELGSEKLSRIVSTIHYSGITPNSEPIRNKPYYALGMLVKMTEQKRAQ
jgi:hypothetical protein